MEKAWMTWRDFNRVIRGKRVIFFGVSWDWSRETLVKSNCNLVYYVDNSPGWPGNLYQGIEVKSPDVLRERSANTYVVITTGAYESVWPQLLELGLQPGTDFCMSPALNRLRVITDIHSHRAAILISSPDHKIYGVLDQDGKVGGGLFTYDIQSLQCKKVLEGTFHQIIDAGTEYLIIDEMRGVCRVSKDFELIETFGMEVGGKPHGIAYCVHRGIVLIAHTGLDKVSAYCIKRKTKLFDIELSDKARQTGHSHHWVNNLCVRGDYLYISLFSHSGCVGEGGNDGGILQVDLADPTKRYVIMDNLWMPHSVRFIDDQICVLESMTGYFYKGTRTIVGEFFGFIRGLACDGNYYYIGQSETRYFDRLQGLRRNIGISAGFYLFDAQSKAAKFFCIPNVRQVHDLCYIGEQAS